MKCTLKFFSVLGLVLMFSCVEDNKIEQEIAQVPLKLKIARFDREFAGATPEDITPLKAKYPYLFPKQFADSIWVAKLKDTVQQELLQEVHKTFGDFKTEEEAIHSLFQHVKYYFPKYRVPKVITLTSEVQYDRRVVLADSLLLLGLDNYLGADHHFYREISKYIAKGLDKAYLTSDIANAFAKTVNRYPKNRSFLSRMLYYGKELYLKDKLIPSATDAQKINYTTEEWLWAQENEEQIWRYFVEQELLYSTASELDRRFLDVAPFSKFRLALDSESPGRLGRYMGWQIVRTFMERNPQTDLISLLDMPADQIFKKSNYKPKK